MSDETSAPRTLPREAIRPAWRAAVMAYRRMRQDGHHEHLAWDAASAAFREVLPQMPEKYARQEVINAVAFAASNHTKWFWQGVDKQAPAVERQGPSGQVLRASALRQPKTAHPQATTPSDIQTKVCACGPSIR